MTMLLPANLDALIEGPGALKDGIDSRALSWLFMPAKLLDAPEVVLALVEFVLALVELVELAVLELPHAAATRATAASGINASTLAFAGLFRFLVDRPESATDIEKGSVEPRQFE